MKILITGASSWTAVDIVRELQRRDQRLCGLDLPGTHPDPSLSFSEWHFEDILDPASMGAWMTGTGAVVHLAVTTDPDDIFSTNVQGTFNVFEAARRHGVGRVILLSSAPVHITPVPGRVLDARRDCLSAPGGDFLYDLTKCLQEQIARHFCTVYGLTALSLRSGHIVDGRAKVDPHGRPLAKLQYCRGGWVDRGDLARTVAAAVLDWQGRGYEAFHVIGARQARTFYDIERTENELGVICEYGFEDYL